MLRGVIVGLIVLFAASLTTAAPVEARKQSGAKSNVSKSAAVKRRAARQRARRKRIARRRAVIRKRAAARRRVARRRAVFRRRIALRRAAARRTARQKTRRATAVVARVDLSSQRMNVYINGRRAHSWAVSTGKRGYSTPRGSYYPTRTYRRYFSKKYYNSPMPYSVFFRGGYAIHGTGELKRLGRPASHGCIRLHPRHAANFYSLVKRVGMRRTRIVITR